MAREEEIGNHRLADIEIKIDKLRRGGLSNVELQTRQTRGIVADIDSVQGDITDILDDIEAIALDLEILVEALADDVVSINFNPDVPSDVYWAHPGAEVHPDWLDAAGGGPTIENWDVTDMRAYMALAGGDSLYSDFRFAWPTGPFGDAHSFEQKIVSATMFILEFRARFNDNADYGATTGIGLLAGSGANFSNTAVRFIQVLRNTNVWELGTCDGTTISQSSGGTGDGSLHDFRVEWESAVVRLYVDDVLTITKATNLPNRPLNFGVVADTGMTIDLMGIRCRWA